VCRQDEEESSNASLVKNLRRKDTIDCGENKIKDLQSKQGSRKHEGKHEDRA